MGVAWVSRLWDGGRGGGESGGYARKKKAWYFVFPKKGCTNKDNGVILYAIYLQIIFLLNDFVKNIVGYNF